MRVPLSDIVERLHSVTSWTACLVPAVSVGRRGANLEAGESQEG